MNKIFRCAYWSQEELASSDRHIASTPKSEGHRVAVFHRGSTPLQELSGIGEILGKKTELPGFRDEFRHFRPEAVIDCIGYTPSDGPRIVGAKHLLILDLLAPNSKKKRRH